MKAYGLRNSFLLYIVPGAIQAYFVILIKTYFESLPSSIEESAMIDGAGFLTIYAKIIVPISMPILATIAVFAAVGQWNSWNDNFFLVSESKLQTLQLVLYNYLSNAQNIYTSITTQDVSMQKLRNMVSPQTIRMAITAVATLPILFAYPFLQRYFVKGIMLGAIKG
jgi:ABC-type glycerol-3-phosphate transport system permease component